MSEDWTDRRKKKQTVKVIHINNVSFLLVLFSLNSYLSLKTSKGYYGEEFI